MPGQRIAAVAGFREAAGRSFDDAELPGRNPDPDIERAAGASPAIGAVAVIGRADLAVILVPHGAAETAAGQDSGYVAGIRTRFRSIAWTGGHRDRQAAVIDNWQVGSSWSFLADSVHTVNRAVW